MGMTDTLRKGLKFLLMSFGISSPNKKPAQQSSASRPQK